MTLMNKPATRSNRREFLSATTTLLAGSAALASGALPARDDKPTLAAKASQRSTLAEVDVLVGGGGPAGIGAALGAARTGANTLLIENHSFFGGVAAWALGMPINQIRPGGKPRST